MRAIASDNPRSGTADELASRDARVLNLKVQLICAWSGVVLLIGFLLGWGWLADMIPPPAPTASPEEIRAFFEEDLTSKRIGILLAMSVWGLLMPWGTALAARTRRAEVGFPVLTIVQVACATSTAALGVLMMMIWGVAAYRPSDMSADTTRMLNDLGWFIFLIDWAPVTLWVFAFGAAVLLDRSTRPVFARWTAYLSFWTGLIFFPAGLIIFFKTGPFAYNGVLALYLPAGVFFLWYAVMTYLLIKALDRELQAATN
jgi:hypothetical protein